MEHLRHSHSAVLQIVSKGCTVSCIVSTIIQLFYVATTRKLASFPGSPQQKNSLRQGESLGTRLLAIRDVKFADDLSWHTTKHNTRGCCPNYPPILARWSSAPDILSSSLIQCGLCWGEVRARRASRESSHTCGGRRDRGKRKGGGRRGRERGKDRKRKGGRERRRVK